jgi:hypothetical protein
MNSIKPSDVAQYIEEHIDNFHQKRIDSLMKLKLSKVLERKNPYLFKAKNILTAQDIVKILLDAYLSSQEETIFGDFLEGLAIYICGEVYGGRKSSSEGIDLEFDKDNIRYIVAIKSGKSWGNSQQIVKMKDNFRRAIRILKTSDSRINVTPINGCCYGRDNKPLKDEYQKLCGQRFWEFISGDADIYTEFIEPLGNKAKERNDVFYESYCRILNNFTLEFANTYCTDGKIEWKKLVEFNSSIIKPKVKRQPRKHQQ